MLKGIPAVISPELLKILAQMGHGDEIVLADANFPAAACAKRVVRADGVGGCAMLEAVLTLLPLDTYETPVYLMQKVPGDPVPTPIWAQYETIIRPHTQTPMGSIERFAFYERAKTAFAVVQTGEKALYANIILKKGVL